MKKELLLPGNFYHIFNRGNNSENIFLEERNYIYFLDLIKKYLLDISHIISFCLLKNHFHLLIQIKEEDKIPDKYVNKGPRIHLAFSNMFNAYTKAVNKAYSRNGSLFQEHFKRIRITDEIYLKQLIVYIHLNPVKHGFTDDFKDYKYSSYSSIVLDEETFIDKLYNLELFGDRDNYIFSHNEKLINYTGPIEAIENIDY